MKSNPFIITPYRKQPNMRMPRGQCASCGNPVNTLVNGMVTLGSVAIIGSTVIGVAGAFQK